jgi:hypothetical protein
MGKAWPGARRVDRLKAKQKESQLGAAAPRSDSQGRLDKAPRVSIADAASVLQMPHQQVLSLVLAGKLTGGRQGGKYWVDSESVRNFKK